MQVVPWFVHLTWVATWETANFWSFDFLDFLFSVSVICAFETFFVMFWHFWFLLCRFCDLRLWLGWLQSYWFPRWILCNILRPTCHPHHPHVSTSIPDLLISLNNIFYSFKSNFYIHWIKCFDTITIIILMQVHHYADETLAICYLQSVKVSSY